MKRYIIHRGTVAILPEFDNFGNETSVVLEKNRTVTVKKRPMDVLKESFQEMGLDYRGSINAARFVLKKRNKIPFAFFAQDDIVLIPVQTIDKKGTIYLVNSHIQEVEELPEGAKVVFKNGTSIKVGMKKDRLNNKRFQASHLKNEMLERYERWRKNTFPFDEEPTWQVSEENEIYMIDQNRRSTEVD